jgi:precorrin-4/cobalt-precorrin-4 C11-methyltransferase
MTGSVVFIGAGPGAPDLITLRGAKAIGSADIVIWAASLVHPGILEHARPGAEVINCPWKVSCRCTNGPHGAR